MKLEQTIDTRRLSSISDHICDAYKGSSLKEGPSPYMDASLLGHRCDRFIWLTFRWAFFYQLPLDGIAELINARNKREKEYAVHNLNVIGIHTTYTEYDKPADIDYGCHIHARPDGYLPTGTIKDESASPHSLMIDTLPGDMFGAVCRNGVKDSFRDKYCQMQLEMYGFHKILKMPCERALYHAVNKEDDRGYDERIVLDRDEAKALLERGKYIVLSRNMPEGDPKKDCEFCPFAEFCYPEKYRMLPEVNCRTCCFSTPKEDGTWYCERWEDTIPTVTAQHHACESHCIIPDLVPDWKIISSECTDNGPCYFIEEVGFHRNGEVGEPTTHIMRLVLNKENKSDEYLDIKYHLEAIPDPNNVIPF